jgi:hypothetical protein
MGRDRREVKKRRKRTVNKQQINRPEEVILMTVPTQATNKD